MTVEEFKLSLKKNAPPENLGPLLKSPWYDAKARDTILLERRSKTAGI